VVLLFPLGRTWAQPVGFVAALEGDVEVLATGTTSWTAAAVDRDVEVGDTIRTGPGSAVKILLIDETILTLGEETELPIDSYIVGPNATRDPSVLKLLKGKARVLVGEAFGGPTRVEMHTPTAVIGVKGSEFDAHIVDDPRRGKWTLCCNLGGSVFVRPVDPGVGGSEEPRLGFCTKVFPDVPPEREIPRPAQFPPVRQLKGKAEVSVIGGGVGQDLTATTRGPNDRVRQKDTGIIVTGGTVDPEPPIPDQPTQPDPPKLRPPPPLTLGTSTSGPIGPGTGGPQ
jgi:hypothetical protein